MEQALYVLAAIVTIVSGISVLPKFWRWFKENSAEWTRRGRKVIYIWTSRNKGGDVTVCLYLCGEETSLFYPSTCENCEPYILAMRQIRYDISYRSYSDRDYSEWMSMFIKPLSQKQIPCVVQLVGEHRFQFWLTNEIGEVRIASDSFKFKTELKECLKKCEIKYDKKASNPQDKWKARDK